MLKKYANMNVYILLFCSLIALSHGFNVGVKNTKCSLDPKSFNDPCGSLYDAICDGKYCKCPSGKKEVNGACVKGTSSGSSDFDDLPFEYLDKDKTTSKTTTTRKPAYPEKPKPTQAGRYPQQPGYNPNAPGGYPQQPGYNPNAPGGYPQQPGYNPNAPGGYPKNPGQYPKQPDNNVAEKTGGGIGGGVGLLLLIGLIYFCCCRGEKGRQFMSKFPMGRRNNTSVQQPQANYQMQPQPYPNQPPGQQVYYPPQQPQQPPPGAYPGAPPAYAPNYPPTAP